MYRMAVTIALLVGVLFSTAAADEWHDRVIKELKKLEKTVGKLDKQKVEAQDLRGRVVELDQRVVELAKKAGLEITAQKVYEGEDRDSLIGSIAQTVMNLKSRIRKVEKAHKVKASGKDKTGETKGKKVSEKTRRSQRRRNIRRVRNRLVREFLEEQGVTTVTTKTSTCKDIEVTAVVQFDGKFSKDVVKKVVSFTMTSNTAKARFALVGKVKFVADDNEIWMKVKRNATALPNTVLEILSGKVGLNTFAYIAYACDVDIVIAGQTFKATTELQGTLLELAQLLDLPDPYERAGRE